MAILYIPNSVGLRNFEGLFKNNTFDFSDGVAEVTFHDKFVGLHPVAVAFYASIADQLKSANVTIKGSINPKLSTIPFLQRIGFLNPSVLMTLKTLQSMKKLDDLSHYEKLLILQTFVHL
jgi:hypothetical protein